MTGCAGSAKPPRSRHLDQPRPEAYTLPLFHKEEVLSMETFFVRKQIVIGVAFLAALELTFLVINAIRHAF